MPGRQAGEEGEIMNMFLMRLAALVLGYVFGMISMAYIAGKIHGVDIRTYGSGNAGTTNAIRVLGTRAGLIVFFLDLAKCLVALALSGLIFGRIAPDQVYLFKMWTFAGVVMGHDFPFYLGFRGGKGVAVMAGFAFGYNLKIFLPLFCVLFFVPYLLTFYVSLGSLCLYAGAFVGTVIAGQLGALGGASQAQLVEIYVIQGCLSALAFYQHRANIHRLATHSERKTKVFGHKKDEGIAK